MKVVAQINNGNSCPKRERDAWDWEQRDFPTIEECIHFLIEQKADGFTILTDDGHIVADDIQSHYGTPETTDD